MTAELILWTLAIAFPVFELLGVLSAVRAIMDTRTAQGAVAWVISLIAFPMLAVPLYWVFGRRSFQGYRQAFRTDRFQDVLKRTGLADRVLLRRQGAPASGRGHRGARRCCRPHRGPGRGNRRGISGGRRLGARRLPFQRCSVNLRETRLHPRPEDRQAPLGRDDGRRVGVVEDADQIAGAGVLQPLGGRRPTSGDIREHSYGVGTVKRAGVIRPVVLWGWVSAGRAHRLSSTSVSRLICAGWCRMTGCAR